MFIRQSRTQRWIQTKALLALILALSLTAGLVTLPLWASAAAVQPYQTVHKTLAVNGVEIFYREAGPADAPTIVLLHGWLKFFFRGSLWLKLGYKYVVVTCRNENGFIGLTFAECCRVFKISSN